MRHRYIKKLRMALSPLGFGVMRLPMTADGGFVPEIYSLLGDAYKAGINYFDTAYPYLGGRSEGLIREALVARFPRDSFHIADKLPVWDCRNRDDMERTFNVQLERLGVRYIDFYLLHGLHRSRWLDAHSQGVLDFLEEKRREGRILKAGFSFHDTADVLPLILDAYNWDFAQLQINYYDWTMQCAKDCYDTLAERDIPCLVMEPVGGGRLAELPFEAETLLKNERPGDSVASWAIRFAAGLPNVAVTLSGMGDQAQLADNLSAMSALTPLTEAERAALRDVVKIVSEYNAIPCTGCGYCADDCPKNVDIPQIFKRYNDSEMFGNMPRFDDEYFAFLPGERQASNCVACGECRKKCPQAIDIPRELKMIVGLLLDTDVEKLKNNLADGSLLVCFGAGAMGRNALSALRGCGCEPAYFCDNAERLWGGEIGGVEIISPAKLHELNNSHNLLALITSGHHAAISEQLKAMGVRLVE